MGPPALLLAGESNRQECPISVQPPTAIHCYPLLRQCPLAMPFGCGASNKPMRVLATLAISSWRKDFRSPCRGYSARVWLLTKIQQVLRRRQDCMLQISQHGTAGCFRLSKLLCGSFAGFPVIYQ